MTNETLDRFRTAHLPLAAVLAAPPEQGWDAPSPCEGWSARDVLSHLVDTQREFLTGRGLDLGPAPDLGDDPAAAWAGHAQQVQRVLSDDDVPAAAYDGFFGPTTVGATFEQFYVWDMLVHRWDLAVATGQDAALSDAELDQVERGADSFGGALHMDGICKPAVAVPDGAGRQERVLARLGRTVRAG